VKALPAGIALLLLVAGGTSARAKDQNSANNGANKGVAALKKGLDAMIAAASPPGQSKRPVDPDQGDDNASDRAIQVVCTKDTPAAERSAICPRPVSP
jgi:hypothetical protein